MINSRVEQINHDFFSCNFSFYRLPGFGLVLLLFARHKHSNTKIGFCFTYKSLSNNFQNQPNAFLVRVLNTSFALFFFLFVFFYIIKYYFY